MVDGTGRPCQSLSVRRCPFLPLGLPGVGAGFCRPKRRARAKPDARRLVPKRLPGPKRVSGLGFALLITCYRCRRNGPGRVGVAIRSLGDGIPWHGQGERLRLPGYQQKGGAPERTGERVGVGAGRSTSRG